MRTLLALIVSTFMLTGCVTTSIDPHQIDEQATAQAPWKVGEVIDPVGLATEVPWKFYFVKFFGITTQGDYLVQIFYTGSVTKRTDPLAWACTLREAPNGDPELENCNPVGGVIEWHENGQKRSETYYQDGKAQGLVTEWYANGQKISEVHYQDGKAQGLVIEWHANGQKRSEAYYEDGKAQGFVTTWYESGQKQFEEHYQEGKKHGLWTTWYESGNKLVERWFENDRKVEERWYENGVEARRQEY